MRCDFCRSPLARWRYAAGRETWRACERCHAAIQADDREALLDRVMAQPVPRTVPDRYARPFQEKARELHDRFWTERTGPAEPL